MCDMKVENVLAYLISFTTKGSQITISQTVNCCPVFHCFSNSGFIHDNFFSRRLAHTFWQSILHATWPTLHFKAFMFAIPFGRGRLRSLGEKKPLSGSVVVIEVISH